MSTFQIPALAAHTVAAATTVVSSSKFSDNICKSDEPATAPKGGKPSPAWWHQGGIVDRLDRFISLPLLMCPSLGPLEYLLTLPGSGFGVPIYGMCVATVLVAMLWDSYFSPEAMATTLVNGTCPDPADENMTCTHEEIAAAGMVTYGGGVLMALAVIFWSYCVWESKVPGMDNETQGINRLFAPLGKSMATLMNLASPHIAATIIRICGGADTGALQVGGFYFASYLVCQLVCEVVKTLSRRFRPVVAMKEQLKLVKRELPQYQWIFVQGHAAGSSLPSADVAGASMFSTMLLLMASEDQMPTVLVYACWITGVAFFMRGRF